MQMDYCQDEVALEVRRRLKEQGSLPPEPLARLVELEQREGAALQA